MSSLGYYLRYIDLLDCLSRIEWLDNPNRLHLVPYTLRFKDNWHTDSVLPRFLHFVICLAFVNYEVGFESHG